MPEKIKPYELEPCTTCEGRGFPKERYAITGVDRFVQFLNCEDCEGTGEIEVAA